MSPPYNSRPTQTHLTAAAENFARFLDAQQAHSSSGPFPKGNQRPPSRAPSLASRNNIVSHLSCNVHCDTDPTEYYRLTSHKLAFPPREKKNDCLSHDENLCSPAPGRSMKQRTWRLLRGTTAAPAASQQDNSDATLNRSLSLAKTKHPTTSNVEVALTPGEFRYVWPQLNISRKMRTSLLPGGNEHDKHSKSLTDQDASYIYRDSRLAFSHDSPPF